MSKFAHDLMLHINMMLQKMPGGLLKKSPHRAQALARLQQHPVSLDWEGEVILFVSAARMVSSKVPQAERSPYHPDDYRFYKAPVK